MLNLGSIINAPITGVDVKNCSNIYGPMVEAVKGKTKNIGCQPVPREQAIPPLRSTVSMHSDIMFADEVAMLITVVKPLNLVMATDVAITKNFKAVSEAILGQIAILANKNFIVTNLYVDPERSFLPLLNSIPGVHVNISAAGSHVPIVERCITVIKNSCRSTLAGLCYNLPKRLVKYLVLFTCNRINCINRSSGIGISAREAFRGQKLDYRKDVKLNFSI